MRVTLRIDAPEVTTASAALGIRTDSRGHHNPSQLTNAYF